MLKYSWNKEKNKLLIEKRGIGFDEIVKALQEDKAITSIPHPNYTKYPRQKMYIVIINDYAYAVPYVKNEQNIFLKTIYPSRKFNKKYNKLRRSK